MSINLPQLRTRARQYRITKNLPTGGVVLFWRGQAYGWKNCLRDPQHECPGALAVDADGRAYQAIDGNERDGAQRWQEVAA
jgi:hypothetical protein